MTIPYEYDPETCVSAGELRERGFHIPEKIPDCAWIPEGSWTVTGLVDVKVDEKDSKMFHISLGDLIYTQPFRWTEGTYLVQRENKSVPNKEFDND